MSATLAKRIFGLGSIYAGATALVSLVVTVPGGAAPDLRFNATVVDASNSGDCKAAGDIDGDLMPDLMVGGMPAEGISWYHYPSWRRTVIARPQQEYTTDCAMGDVDGDGALDIVVPDGEGQDNLKWFRNPGPGGDPFDPARWQEHTIGTVGGWGKDVELADFDSDGRPDVATRHHTEVMIFFQDAEGGWSRLPLATGNLAGEGLASGDIDGDGHVDLVIHGAWLKNPGAAAAQSAGSWAEYAIGDAPGEFKAVVADLDGDGAMDVAFSASEGIADVRWWKQPRTPGEAWTSHTIVEAFERGHTLQAADMDNDGDLDIVLAQMHTSATREVLVLENLDGRATQWRRHLIDTTGLHNGVVVDIGNDGDLDIFGSNWVGNPPVRLWLNRLDPNGGPLFLDRWTPIQVTGRSTQTFGLGFADIDGDGLDDVIAGQFVHLNPGGDMTGTWEHMELPWGMHGFGAARLRSDGALEILAQKTEDDLVLYALLPPSQSQSGWTSRRLGSVPAASHDLGAQGYKIAQLHPGGPPEIILTSGNGLYYFVAPGSGELGQDWKRVHVSARPSDEGVAVGDIDDDGLLDLAATTGEQKGVEWYRNPGDGSDQWPAYQIGGFPEAVYPDRVEVADLSGSGRLDVIVTEENGEGEGAYSFWWQQPAQPTDLPWPRHLLTVQATTNSLDLADFDGDGAVDIVTGEHRGDRRVILWHNDGHGGFVSHEIDRGRESHLGVRTHDLDGDGDLDLVSIGYDDDDHIWLWRNDAIAITGLNVDVESAPTAAGWLARLRQIIAEVIY
jgi:hypothetical protein